MENTSAAEKILFLWRNRHPLNMLAAMEAVFDYRIPVLHPLAVHFPLTLLLAAAIAALFWMFRGTPFWRHCTAFLVFLNLPAAWCAFLTGDAMQERSEGVPIVEELVHLHEDLGLYTLIASCVIAAVMGVVVAYSYRRGTSAMDPIAGRVLVGLLILFSAALVTLTAHIGATMTWGVAAP